MFAFLQSTKPRCRSFHNAGYTLLVPSEYLELSFVASRCYSQYNYVRIIRMSVTRFHSDSCNNILFSVSTSYDIDPGIASRFIIKKYISWSTTASTDINIHSSYLCRTTVPSSTCSYNTIFVCVSCNVEPPTLMTVTIYTIYDGGHNAV
jgi:hypothetical protein